MGSYSELAVGRFNNSWKYHVPSHLLFLFSESDFCFNDEQNESECQECRLGYKTTVSSALIRMEQAGYGMHFVKKIYKAMRDDFFDDVRSSIAYRFEKQNDESYESDDQFAEIIESKTRRHIAAFKTQPIEVEVDDFLNFFSAYCKATVDKSKESKKVETARFSTGDSFEVPYSASWLFDTHENWILWNGESLRMFLHNRELEMPPWILAFASFLEVEFVLEFGELTELLITWLCLKVSDPNDSVYLDISDLDYEQPAAQELLERLRFELARKVSLYNQVFDVFLGNEGRIRERYIKERASIELENCLATENRQEKGVALESLIGLLFEQGPSLSLVNKRVSTGDQEIDLVIRNNVDRPFWKAFNSPLIFIECKNWEAKVGAKEVRDFETKVRNHGSMVKVGIFIAINDFSMEVHRALSRVSRENYHLVLLTGQDLRSFCTTDVSFFDWLEKKMSEIH